MVRAVVHPRRPGQRQRLDVDEHTGTDVHDLTFANGVRTQRLAPGESETVEVGLIGADLDGWCSIAGHRQMGMELTVVVTGAPAGGTGGSAGTASGSGSMSGHDHGSTTGAASAADDIADGTPEGEAPWEQTTPKHRNDQ